MLQIRDEGVLAEFALGAAIAASFYTPAVSTEDLDIFAFFKVSESGLLALAPLYARLVELGGRIEKEYVVLGKRPVPIFPAYTPLVEQAVRQSVQQAFGYLHVWLVNADCLCAIAPQVGRPKDYLRVHALIASGHVQSEKLAELVSWFSLARRWGLCARRYFRPDKQFGHINDGEHC